MKICVFGGTGATGSLFVSQALDQGWDVTVYIRSPEKLGDLKAKVTAINGTLEDREKITQAIGGQDVIVSTLGSKQPDPGSLLADATRLIVEAMSSENIARILAVSSLGCRESLKLISNLRFLEMINGPFRPNWDDKDNQEAIIEESGLDYTIARPGGLTDAPLTGSYHVSAQHKAVPQDLLMISRADVAHFLVQAIKGHSHSKAIISLYS